MLFLSCFQVLVWLWLQLWKATAASSSCLRRWAWRRWVLRHIVWVPGSVRVTCLCHCSENILGIIVKHPSVWNKSHRNDQYWTWFFPFSTTGVLQDIGPRKKLDILSGMWQALAPSLPSTGGRLESSWSRDCPHTHQRSLRFPRVSRGRGLAP